MRTGTTLQPDVLMKCPGCSQLWLDKQLEFKCLCTYWIKTDGGLWLAAKDLTAEIPSPT